MGYRLYIAKIKCLCRDRQSMFWVLLFPFILTVVYYITLGQMEMYSPLETMNIATVVVEEEAKEGLTRVLEDATFEDGKPIFEIIEVEEWEAKQLLDRNEIEGYIKLQRNPEFVVKTSNTQATIIKNVLDIYLQMESLSYHIIANNNGNPANIERMLERKNYLVPITQREATQFNGILIYFYALLAMASMNGANWGLREGLDIIPSLSSKGKRVYVAPYSQLKLLWINLLASLTLHCLGMAVVFGFMVGVIGIDFGGRLPFAISVCLLGSIIGVMLGCLIAIATDAKESKKDAVLTLIVVGGAFLSGMMVSEIKYIVATKLPLLTVINPIYVVTDCLYSLYYYEDLTRYFNGIRVLLLTAGVYGLGILWVIRRRKRC